MFLLNFIRWLAGSVSFTASGGFGERFINLCALSGINLRNTKITKEALTATVNAKDYFKLRSAAKKSGMRIRLTKKSGLYFFARRNRRRYGLLIGAVFFALFLSFTSLFIWSVDVIGCDNYSRELIEETLSQIGLHEGAFKSGINTSDMANLAMIKLSGKISWLAVNIKGTHAIVEVRDYFEKREDVTYTEPCNIVADFDGLILTLEVHNGHKANFEGSGVKKGDLLISGIFENRNTSSQFMEARGKITALHTVKTSTEAEQNLKCKKYVYCDERKKLSFFSVNLPLKFFEKRKDSYDTFEYREQLCYGNIKLPFAIIRETRAYYKSGVLRDKNSNLRAADEFTVGGYDRFKNTLIISSDNKAFSKNGKYIIEAENECIDYMGVKEKIF